MRKVAGLLIILHGMFGCFVAVLAWIGIFSSDNIPVALFTAVVATIMAYAILTFGLWLFRRPKHPAVDVSIKEGNNAK